MSAKWLPEIKMGPVVRPTAIFRACWTKSADAQVWSTWLITIRIAHRMPVVAGIVRAATTVCRRNWAGIWERLS